MLMRGLMAVFDMKATLEDTLVKFLTAATISVSTTSEKE